MGSLKSVRNTLGRMKILLDEDGNKIQWLHFEELHKLQEVKGLHLANKLRVKHIDYSKNKMKVKLASQLLSTSVANALQLCKDKLMLPQFQDCSASIRFTVIFDNLFDILNSRNQRQHGFKKPISCNNYFEIIQKVDECSQYIKSLFIDEPRQSILNFKFKTGFLGWLINIQSMQQMYKFLCIDNEYLKYIPMYKISQDHLELIFGNIRSCGGYNNNPTVRQFKSAFKKLIIHTEIKEGNTGNCIPLEEIYILNISSNLKQSKNPVNIINETANENSQKWFSDLDDTAYIDHDYCLEIPLSFTEYKNEVITYLAGYIARKLMKTLHCVECVGALIEQNADTKNNYNLINIKNRGSLIYPSKDLVYISKKIENTIRHYLCENETLSNFNMNTFVCKVMEELIHINIFPELKEHVNDQSFSSNHVNHLLRIIIESYTKTRLAHYIQNVRISDRHKLNKLILFRGQ